MNDQTFARLLTLSRPVLLGSLFALTACSSESHKGEAPLEPIEVIDVGPAEPLSRWRDASQTVSVDDPAVVAALHDVFDGSPVPGAVGAIADRNGDVRVGAIGVRKAGSDVPFTADDLVHIGSDTKAMTGVLIARLVDAGLLRWDSTIGEVMPDLAAQIDPAYGEVTVFQLLHHTSGAPANAEQWWGFAKLPVHERRIQIAAQSLAGPPLTEPGSTYLYSNLGVMVAGVMAATVGEATWEELMVREVFEPLGMSSAGFGVPGEIGATDQPWGHTIEASGRARPKQADNAPALGPAGTVHLSIADWARFVLEFTDAAAADPGFLSTESRAKLVERGLDDYACGWTLVERPWAGGTALTHSGSNTMWFATAWVAPRKDMAFLVVVNADGFRVRSSVDRAIGALFRVAETPIVETSTPVAEDEAAAGEER